MDLRPYQQQAVDAVAEAMEIGMPRMSVCLPTGSGKTSVAGTVMQACPGPCLFLAHRISLVEQAAKALSQFFSPEDIGIVQGDRRELDRRVVVATEQTAAGMADELPWFHTVIVDEAHHTTADTYRTLLYKLNTEFIIGLTATPLRMDGLRVQDVCGRMVYYESPFDLVEQGYLCDLYDDPIYQDDDQHIAFISGWLADQGKRVLVFSSSIGHAQFTSFRICTAGHRATVVHADLEPKEVQERLVKFSNGEYDVLVNVAIVSEGIDIPSITDVVIARPVESLPWLSQAIGRVMRPAPDKSYGMVHRFTTPLSDWCNPASALSTYRMPWLEHGMLQKKSLKTVLSERYDTPNGEELWERDRKRLWNKIGYTPL